MARKKKQIWRFTFLPEDVSKRDFVQPIYGTYETTRNKMFELYGDNWSFQYSQEDWENSKKVNPRPEQDLELIKL